MVVYHQWLRGEKILYRSSIYDMNLEALEKKCQLILNSRREESYDRETRMIRSRYFVMLRKIHLTVTRGSSLRINRNLSDRS